MVPKLGKEAVDLLPSYSPGVVTGDRSAAISSNCSKAERSLPRSPLRSGPASADWPESSMLSSRSQKMSRFALSRFTRIVVAEGVEAFGLLALVTSLRVVARYEIV